MSADRDTVQLDEAIADLLLLLEREAALCALAVPAGVEHRLTCARADVRRLHLRAEPGSSLEGLADRLAGHLEALWLQLAPTAADLVRAGLDVAEALERVDRAAARMGGRP